MTTRSSARNRRGTGGDARRLALTLERNVQAPALARAEVTECCRELGIDGSLCQSLVLLVSEVVSNAVRHSPADPQEPVGFVASFGERAIRVMVTDAGEGFTPRPRDPARAHDGYGLYLLEKVADRWGVDSRGDTKVWFELARA
ncbi:MAG TPA: ATP-binding protein [Solirubrobacteraceae bacterium]|nr:ATP-binding protein [Solirubrobacteraceae bacterium]